MQYFSPWCHITNVLVTPFGLYIDVYVCMHLADTLCLLQTLAPHALFHI